MAVYLRQSGEHLPARVVVTGRGRADPGRHRRPSCRPTTATATRQRHWVPGRSPRGTSSYFPQPGKVVRLDTTTGDVRSYAVPSPYVEDVGWSPADSVVVVRTADHAWTLDPWKPGAKVVPADSTRVAGTATLGVTTDTRSLGHHLDRPHRQAAAATAIRAVAGHRAGGRHAELGHVGRVGRLLRPEPHQPRHPSRQRPDLPGAGGHPLRDRTGHAAAGPGEPRRADRPGQGVLHRPRLGERRHRPAAEHRLATDPGSWPGTSRRARSIA